MKPRHWLSRLSLLLRILLVGALLSAPAVPLHAAPQTQAKLNHALGPDQRVLDFKVSPDGSRILYRIGRTLPPAQDFPPPPPADLFSVPTAGGTAVQLNPPVVNPAESVESFQFNPAGDQVVYLRTTTDTVQGGIFKVDAVGNDLRITDGRNRTAAITSTDLAASNGVIHVIDTVLMP